MTETDVMKFVNLNYENNHKNGNSDCSVNYGVTTNYSQF